MRSMRHLIAGLAIIMVAGACGPKLQTTLTPGWTTPIDMEIHETATVSDGGSSAVVAFEKDVRVVDTRTGEVVYLERPKGGLMAFAKRQVKVGNVSLADMQGGDRYGYAFVPGSDLVLLFDNTLANEEVRALSGASGEEAWKNADYLWSLEQYGRVGEALLGAMLDLDASGAAGPVLALGKFVSELTVPVPELDALLMNTVGDLKLLDAATGRELWSLPEFDASGIGRVVYLDDTDDLLILARTRGVIESITGAKRMMRVDARTGALRWSTSYAGQPVSKWVQGDSVLDVRTVDDRILLNFMGVEAYDLATGDRVFDTLEGSRRDFSSVLGSSPFETPWTGRPVVHDGIVYTHHAANWNVGYPDQLLRGYDLRTGERVWESTPIESMADLRDLALVDGLLVARVTGPEEEGLRRGGALLEPGLAERGYVAWDVDTGELAWTRRELGKQVTNLLAARSGLYASDGDRILRLDPRTGETLLAVDHAAAGVGRAGVLMEADDQLVVVGYDGVAFYAMADLDLRSALPVGSVESYAVRGDLLVLQVDAGAHAIDLATGRELGTISNLGSAYTGNLRHGYHITPDGRAIFVLHPGMLAVYPTR